MMRAVVVALALLAAAPAQAQEPAWDPGATRDCLARAGDAGARRACIGLSAEICMAAPGGSSTVGMGACLYAELDWWDARLNAAYQALMAAERSADAEDAKYQPSLPKRADALRAMQRAWIPWRDATCEYERTQWGGGTGGGPATAACLMRLTAEQAMYLDAQMAAR